MEPAQPINLNFKEKLKDKNYRRNFFRAQDSAQIAEQLVALRKCRGLNQTQVAELSGTKQPAISRAEQADYQNRKLETLRAIVEALDGRLRVIIEPAEDVLSEYDEDDKKLEANAHEQEELYERELKPLLSVPQQRELRSLSQSQQVCPARLLTR